jgi:hypothetical protein
MPATALQGELPKAEVRLFLEGADKWPWVPNFRTLIPEAGYLADDAAAIRAKLPTDKPFGLSVRGWIEVPAEQEVTFTAQGAGGCQLWLHEAHILEYELGDCVQGRSTTYKLAAGRHPYKLYLTAKTLAELCTVKAGDVVLV